MERVAEEWRRQGEKLDLFDMPVTRLLNAALDGVARTMSETRAETAAYAIPTSSAIAPTSRKRWPSASGRRSIRCLNGRRSGLARDSILPPA